MRLKKKIKMKTFIVNRNTPSFAEKQRRQIELMSKRIEGLENKVIIYNCLEEPFKGKLNGHCEALEKYQHKECEYYWFNHPDLSFAVDMDCLEKLLNVVEKVPNIAVISPVHSTPYPNKFKKGFVWHPVATCDYLSLLIRRDVIEKIGFLNPEFRYSWGAIHEYSYKIYKNGWCIAYCDMAKVHHFGGTTYGKKDTESREEYKKRAKQFAREYFIKNYGNKWDEKFKNFLPPGVLNTYIMHRRTWERENRYKILYIIFNIIINILFNIINFINIKFYNFINAYFKKIMGKRYDIIENYNIIKNYIRVKEKLKLNLGCGDRKRKGWINVDIDGNVKPDIVADVTDLNMIDDGVVDEIECCHLFEHLTYPDAVRALKEWYRVLKVGGKLSLESPNLKRCAEILYKEEGPRAEESAMIGLYGFIPDIIRSGIYSVHKYGWSPKTLTKELKRVGFKKIKPVSVTEIWRESTKYNRDMRLECIK